MFFSKIETNSEAETKAFAKSLATKLNIGDIVILSGDLGCGKTKFVEGFISNFNLQNEISSPTFNIVNEYSNDNITIFHFDLYRLESINEFYEIGGEEFFDNGICLIEWGELIKDLLPENYIEINFEKDDSFDNKRILKLSAYGERFEALFNMNNGGIYFEDTCN